MQQLLRQQQPYRRLSVIVDQRIKMKVQRIRNGHYWSLLFISTFCMLMQRQQLAIAAAVPANSNGVDSEILSSSNSSNSDDSGNININQFAWPPMEHYDIWTNVTENTDEQNWDENVINPEDGNISNLNGNYFQFLETDFENNANQEEDNNSLIEDNNWRNESLDSIVGIQRQSKVFRIFPVPVDGECLSDDGRRTGTCYNIYQCRQKGGTAKGDCAMGFGVCCVFVVNCNETISNNITYLVSPRFPSFMPNNFTSCSIKVKLMSEDISQLRIDFYHFSLGQPNRRTGVCDGDVFNVSGGPGGTFSLCGQNSGQHIYYDVGGRFLPRQALYGSIRPPTLSQIYPNLNTSDAIEQLIEISMNFAQRFLPIRLWEIRIAQIPFSQRAPAGCLQYHHGTEGVIQTFNFADNGRHLANQHYRVCMRQEREMCSIMYQPCDEQSFRIGPSRPMRGFPQQPSFSPGGSGASGGMPLGGSPATNLMMGIMTLDSTNGMGVVMPGMSGVSQSGMPMVPVASTMASPVAADAATSAPIQMSTTPANIMRSSTVPETMTAAASMETTVAMTTSASMATVESSTTAATTLDPPSTTVSTMAETTTTATTTAAPTTRASMAPSSMTTAAMQDADSSTAATSTTVAQTAASTTAATTEASTASTNPASTQRTTSTASPSTTTIISTTTSPVSTSSSTTEGTLLSDDVEGSGDEGLPADPGKFVPTRRPRPVSGGFDILGFLRSAFDFKLRRRSARQQRQIYSTCSDRITLPCIIEDFIGTSLGPVPSCEPVHCGTQFCSSGSWPCRVESTVTPFFINIHFGNGLGKGSAEDNIGACLRYTQVQCM